MYPKTLLAAALAGAALFGLALAVQLATPREACAGWRCGGNVACVSSLVCISGCACIGGFCTSFSEAPE